MRAAASKRRCAVGCRCCCSQRARRERPAPAALAGAVVQEVAEVLAGLVYVNALSPGHPAIFGTWPFVSDLRTGAMSGGSGEQAVLMAACAQMGRFYDLPTGIAAGMADSKLPDAQAGYEKGYTTVLAGHSGANLVYESAGMLGSLLGACLESFVIDNDMLGAVNRSVRGIDIDDESLSVETMREVCTQGPKPLPRTSADPRAHAARLRLPGGRRSREPEGVGRARIDQRRRARRQAGTRDAEPSLPDAHPAERRCEHPRRVPHPAGAAREPVAPAPSALVDARRPRSPRRGMNTLLEGKYRAGPYRFSATLVSRNIPDLD